MFYEQQDFNPVYKEYIANRLFGQFLLFYLMGLKNNILSIDELQEYDKKLEKYPHVYEIVGTIPFYKGLLKPIIILRKGNSLEKFLLIKVPRWIYTVISNKINL